MSQIKRKVLRCALMAFICVGLLLAFFPFIFALNPNAKAEAARPRLDLDGIELGGFQFFERTSEQYRGERILILKEMSGNLLVFTVPTHEGKVLLPDVHWYRFGALCKNFGPENQRGKIIPDGKIRCLDHAAEEDTERQWSYDGKNLGGYTDDMLTTKYYVDDHFLVFGEAP